MADQKSEVHVEFYAEAVENKAKTRTEGRPIFEDREFVKIRFPGDKHREHVAPANERCLRDPSTNEWLTYIDRYPRHYEAFKKNSVYIGEGTPIDEAPFLTNSQKAELKAVSVYTIEALANMPETFLTRLGMGARAMMNQAKAYIEKAAGSAVETRLAADNADLRVQLAALSAQVASLAQGIPPVATAAETAGDDASPFAGWSPDSLKAYIKDQTGQAPRGNPSNETLIRMAEEARSVAA